MLLSTCDKRIICSLLLNPAYHRLIRPISSYIRPISALFDLLPMMSTFLLLFPAFKNRLSPSKKLGKVIAFTSLFSDWGCEEFLRLFCPGLKPACLYSGVKTDVLIGQAICFWTFPFPSGTSTIIPLSFNWGCSAASVKVNTGSAQASKSANIPCHS